MKASHKNQIAFPLLTLSLAIGLLLIAIEIGWPPTQTSAAASPNSSTVESAGMVDEGSITLAPGNLHLWTHFKQWYSEAISCGSRPAYGNHGTPPEDINGTIVAGFKHSYDKNGKIFPCPNGDNTVYRGTVWFDLSGIVSKAPPLHVSVESATLNFKQSGTCPGELLVASADWMKGYAPNTLVPGDPAPLAVLPSGLRPNSLLGASSLLAKPCTSCSVDVKTVVNNWVKGADHGGYANNGFVFKGMQEADLEYENADSCVSRYGEFSLAVKYKRDQTGLIPPGAVLRIPVPGKTNVALASNGGKATASSTMAGSFAPATVNDGERRGITFLTGGGWISAGPTNNDWLQIDFKGSKTINEIDVFMLRDDYTNPAAPELDTKSTKYGLTNFAVQYWTQFGEWANVTVSGNPVVGNTNIWKQFTLAALRTNKIRILVSKTPDGYSRLTEVEAYGY